MGLWRGSHCGHLGRFGLYRLDDVGADMADVTPHPLTAEAAQALQGVTNLAADCELAAKVMAETGTFETGQAILKEAAAALKGEAND